jgi:hypothetical protein
MIAGLAIAAAAIAAATAAPGPSVPVRLEAPTIVGFAPRDTLALTSSSHPKPRRVADVDWWGGTFTVTGGERVTVYVSRTYPEVDSVAQQWADFFGGLPHGAELSRLRAYVAPLPEVQEMCESEYVIGCYGSGMLVTVGDSSAGIPPASVAAHEYGHHIAANRTNAPWRAVDWGTKRWASAMQICARVHTGSAFPGDEGLEYSFNPGEAFAESYRVLVETHGTAIGYDWPIVDPSFEPDAAALAAVRDDVVQPWTAPHATTQVGRFLRRNRTWTTRVATPLDGDLHVGLTVPGGGAHNVTLLASDGRTVLRTASWNSSGGKSLEYRICGRRSLVVRVTRGSAAARFSLRVVAP